MCLSHVPVHIYASMPESMPEAYALNQEALLESMSDPQSMPESMLVSDLIFLLLTHMTPTTISLSPKLIGINLDILGLSMLLLYS